MAILGQHIGQALCDALNLPKCTTSFTLRVQVDRLVTVECEYYPTDNDALVKAFAEFTLTPKDAAAPLNFNVWMRTRTDRADAAYMARMARMGGLQ